MKVKCCIFMILMILFPAQKFCQKVYSQDALGKSLRADFYGDSKNNLGFGLNFLFGQVKFSYNQKKQNIGFSTNTEKTGLSPIFFLKFGNISASGSLSKLGNPLFSASATPFSTSLSEIKDITSYLPSYTSFTNPFGLYLQLSSQLKRKQTFSWKCSTYWDLENGETAFSLFSGKKFFYNNITLSSQVTAGLFLMEEKAVSSWFTDDDFYCHSGLHFSSISQLSVKLFNFHSIFSLISSESPFGKLNHIYKLENKITSRKFSFLISGLYNPNHKKDTFITSSGKTISPCFQVKCGLEHKSPAGKKIPVFIKNGVNFYGDFTPGENEGKLKAGLGSQISSNLFSFLVTFTANGDFSVNNKTPFIFDSFTLKIKNSWYLKVLTPLISLSYTHNPSSDFSYTKHSANLKAGLYYPFFPKISTYGTFSLTARDNEIESKKLSGTISSKFELRKVNVVLKFSADITL